MAQRLVTQSRPGFLGGGMAKRGEAVGWAQLWSFGAVGWAVVRLAKRQSWVVKQGLERILKLLDEISVAARGRDRVRCDVGVLAGRGK